MTSITAYGDLRWLGIYSPEVLVEDYQYYAIDFEDHIHRRIANHFEKGRTQESLYVREQLHKAQVLELRIQRKPRIERDSWSSVTPIRPKIDLAKSWELSGNLFGAELFLEDSLALLEAEEDYPARLGEPGDPFDTDDKSWDVVRIVQQLARLYSLSKKRIENLDSDFSLTYLSSGLSSSSFILDRAARIDSHKLWVRLEEDGVMDHEIFAESALHTAAKHNACKLARFALGLGVDVNIKDHDGIAALHEAIDRRHIDMVKLLIVAGADIEAEDWSSETPLHQAAAGKDDIRFVVYLLWKGARIEAQDDDQRTPLHHAISVHNPDIVRSLLEQGADVNARPPKHLYLHTAARSQDSEILELLLEHGADVTAKDDEGDTALHRVATSLYGHTSCGDHGDCIKTLLDRGLPVDARGHYMETALHRASDVHDPDAVKCLLQRGASVMAEAVSGTPLHYAIGFHMIGSVSKACNVIRMLLDFGAVVNFRRRTDGKTPLHLAGQLVEEEEARGLKFLEILLDHGGDAEILDNSFMTAVGYSGTNEAALGLFANHRRGSAI